MTPGGSSSVHIYTQTIDRTTQLVYGECGPCLINPCICFTNEKKPRKKLSQGKWRVPVGTMKTNVQNRTYIKMRIYKYIKYVTYKLKRMYKNICIYSNNVRHPVTKTFTTFHYTSSSYTLLHLSTLQFLPFNLHPTTLHCPLI